MTLRRTLGWNPARTWAFVVGILEWKHDDLFESFPKENRRDAALVELLQKQGIPQDQIVYLQDRQATTRRIQQSFASHLAKARAGDLLLVYFTGHGDRSDDGSAYFASYDADGDANQGWVVDTIPATIEEHFAGARALLIADCCCSGSLIDAAAQQAQRVGYACLASSLANETSTGNWTFTEDLMAGLSGLAFVDADGDSAITLRELAAQIAATMAFAEEQIATFGVTKGFDPNMVLATARPRPHPRVGQRVGVFSEDEWYRAQIVAVRGKQLKVHFYGYDESDDEWVTDDLIRNITRPSYPVGAAVAVKRKRTWLPATVKEVREGIHYIQYESLGPEWNEWAPLSRIRPLA